VLAAYCVVYCAHGTVNSVRQVTQGVSSLLCGILCTWDSEHCASGDSGCQQLITSVFRNSYLICQANENSFDLYSAEDAKRTLGAKQCLPLVRLPLSTGRHPQGFR